MRVLTAMGLTISLVLAGCYRTHTRASDAGPSLDARTNDAWAEGTWSIDGGLIDAVSVDSPRDESGRARCECCPGVSVLSTLGCAFACVGMCDCTPRRAETVCFQTAVADVPTEITLELPDTGECFCGQALECSIDAEATNMEIGVAICPSVPCASCETAAPVARCTIPARPAGRHQAGTIGARRGFFDLDVVAPSDPLDGAEICVRTAPYNCMAPWEPEAFVSDRACHESSATTGAQVTIHVEESCDAEMQPGHCTVSVSESVITVRATRVPTSCTGFGPTPGCTHPVHECVTPRLRDGHYTVLIDGLDAPGAPSTIDVSPSGGVAVEICRGSRT